VAAQLADPSSLLQLYRALIALRRAHPALSRGEQRSLPATDAVWAFERALGGERFAIALNFGDEPATCALGAGAPIGGLRTRAGAALPASLARVELAPCEGAVLRTAR
jgi:alpha-glucosidase